MIDTFLQKYIVLDTVLVAPYYHITGARKIGKDGLKSAFSRIGRLEALFQSDIDTMLIISPDSCNRKVSWVY